MDQTTTEVTLSLQDIDNTIKVIDYACEQGAFKGWTTIEQVIGVRSKLANFLMIAAQQQGAPSEPEVAEPTEAP